MKILKSIFLSLFVLTILPFQTSFAEMPQEAVLYYGDGCTHCAELAKHIEENEIDFAFTKKEVYRNPDNAQEFNEVCDSLDIDLYERGVPFLYVEDECFIGSDEIITYLDNNYIPVDVTTEAEIEAETVNTESSQRQLTIPLLLGAALVDAINPCAFAVLLILMTTILASGQRKRSLLAGLAFALSIFISYLLMGLGLYSVVASMEFSLLFTKIIGVVAILLGLLNLKDFFWYGKGVLMEVPRSWRAKMKKIIRSVTSPIGAFLIGFIVSLFLLPCTSGPYIVVVSMLGQKETFMSAVWLLVLYNLVFILPMILITLGTYFGMNTEKAEKIRQKNLQRLHLVAGIIMLIMGVVLVTGLV